MNPGDLSELISFLSDTPAPDGMGGLTENWSIIATVWARVREAGAGEHVDAGGTRHERTLSVVIRTFADLSPTLRVRIGGEDYAVTSVTRPAPRDLYMSFEAKSLT